MIDLWYKDAVVYELDVKVYQDSNRDGIGDFQGLIQRLPHIAGLGLHVSGWDRHESVDISQTIDLEGYGYRWLRISGAGWKHTR